MTTMEEQMIPILSSIRKRKRLWNGVRVSRSNRDEIDKLWKAVAAEVKVPESVIRKRWVSARDRYRRILSQIKAAPEYERTVTWKLYPHLAFLKDVPFTKRPKMLDDYLDGDDSSTLTASDSAEADSDFEDEIFSIVETTTAERPPTELVITAAESISPHELIAATESISRTEPVSTTELLTEEFCDVQWQETLPFESEQQMKSRHMEELHQQRLRMNREKHTLELEILREELCIKKRQRVILDEFRSRKKAQRNEY